MGHESESSASASTTCLDFATCSGFDISGWWALGLVIAVPFVLATSAYGIYLLYNQKRLNTIDMVDEKRNRINKPQRKNKIEDLENRNETHRSKTPKQNSPKKSENVINETIPASNRTRAPAKQQRSKSPSKDKIAPRSQGATSKQETKKNSVNNQVSHNKGTGKRNSHAKVQRTIKK